MNEKARAAVLVATLVAVVAVTWWFWPRRSKETAPAAPVPKVTTVAPSKGGQPIMLEVGSAGGIPDQMMAAVMLTLREGFRSRLEVRFEDAGRDPSLREKYGLAVVPTQIFYSPDGKEIGRHDGFASEQAILNKLKSLGYDLMAAPTPAQEEPATAE